MRIYTGSFAVQEGPFYSVLYGADNLGDSTWEIRDLMQYGLDGAEKYMALAFECGIAMKKELEHAKRIIIE